ncbi:unannotated protein [freshwater metagenome]|uniref:Unannotated protein n=1 Tax=freshwater metagenome TaxID=449393 RepID=A0A6J6IUG3_9ZZZZ|nr:hypothetical protein [Actinomycetota bacterium]
MFQPNPPEPRSLPDAELNAKIAQLQSQPGGLVAAMALIEEQSRLRQEDSLELSKWQLQAQMLAATATAEPAISELQDPAFTRTPTLPEPAATQPRSEVPAEPKIEMVSTPAPVAPVQPIAAAEAIDDIVTALNAAYVQVATEPEKPKSALPQSVAGAQDSQPSSYETTAEVPEPLESHVFGDQKTDISEERDRSTGELTVLEDTGPTGTSAALSWSWLAIASTPLTLVLAAVLKEAGISFSQALILLGAVVLGTSILASIGAMAAVRGSSSMTLVSRASFGVWGNALPGTLMLLVRIFWSASLVLFATRVISPLVSNQSWFTNIVTALALPPEFTATMIVVIPLVVISSVLAGFGGSVMLRLQQLTAIVAVVGLGVIGYFVIRNYSLQDLESGVAIPGSSFVDLGLLVVALLSFTVFSLSGDFARKLPSETPGSKVFFLSFVSTSFIPLASGVIGLLWLYMAGDTLGSSLSDELLATVASSAPIWVFVPFVVAVGMSALHLMASSLYSLSGNIFGLVKINGWVSQLLIVLLVLATVLVPSYLVAVSTLQEAVIELMLIGGVVAAAWAGVFVSDALARTRGYHEVSLTREYGFYGKLNFANVIGFLLSVGLGLGYINGGPQLSSWTGYLGNLTPEIFELVGSNIGLAMAFGLAVLFPIVFGIPRIRKQEKSLAELDERRQELKEFLDAAQ